MGEKWLIKFGIDIPNLINTLQVGYEKIEREEVF